MEDKVIQIIAEHMNIDKSQLSPDSRLLEDLSLSSFDMILLLVEFEESFNLEININDVIQFRTISDVIAFLAMYV